MVAAHVWDLLGARNVGFGSALITRGVNPPLRIAGLPQPDLVVGDLHELADRLTAEGRPRGNFVGGIEPRGSLTMPEQEFDAVVLGAGRVGQNAADRARAAGLSVAVVERELVGGECSYWACVPSKALLRPVLAISDARRVDGAREAVNAPINPAGVFGRATEYVSDWDDTGQAEWVDGIGATLIRGHGRLDGPRRVVVVHAG